MNLSLMTQQMVEGSTAEGVQLLTLCLLQYLYIFGMCTIHCTLYTPNYFLTSVFKINNILPFSIIFSLLDGHTLEAPEHV